jgi:hypothetical protein
LDIAEGPLPLTPIVGWLLEDRGPIDHFNQSVLLQAPAGLRQSDLIHALQCLIDHHDALRLRLAQVGDGWRLETMGAGTVAAATCLHVFDVGGFDEARLHACLAEHAIAAQMRLNPVVGVIMQAVWFDAGADQSGRLLLVIHHLAVDGVSWRILVPDLIAVWRAIATNSQPVLPPRSTSFRQWALRLVEHAHNPERAHEVGYWTKMLNAPAAPLVKGALQANRDVLSNVRRLTQTPRY